MNTSERSKSNMIIKINAIRDEATGLVDKGKAFVISKDGKYQRVVSLTDEMAAEVAKGNKYFNAMEKDGVLHITGKVVAHF